MEERFLLPEAAKNRLRSGAFDDRLNAWYGVSGDALQPYRARIAAAVDRFAEQYGAMPLRIFSVSGRTELGGNHTDHQHGCVLAGGITPDLIAVAARTDDRMIRVQSEGYPEETVSPDARAVQSGEQGTSRALIRGTAAGLAARGAEVGGFAAYAVSDVQKGSGLSSSAAYEVMLGTVCNDLFAEGALSMQDIAVTGQYAENEYFGKPCGLMDQMACALGGAVYMDFADPASPVWERVPLDLRAEGYALCIIDSGADHADLTEEYAAVPAEMKAVAQALGKKVLRETDEEQFWAELPALRRSCGDRAVLRAMHFYRENRRVQQQAEALKTGDFARYLHLVNESGRSSVLALQNITPCGSSREQAVAAALALCESLLDGAGAYRVHGGGFAGTVQAYVPAEMLSAFRGRTDALLGQGSCRVMQIRKCGASALW